MTLGPIEAVRVFTTRLAEARRFYADTLGLSEMTANDAFAMFDTGQAKLIVPARLGSQVNGLVWVILR